MVAIDGHVPNREGLNSSNSCCKLGRYSMLTRIAHILYDEEGRESERTWGKLEVWSSPKRFRCRGS